MKRIEIPAPITIVADDGRATTLTRDFQSFVRDMTRDQNFPDKGEFGVEDFESAQRIRMNCAGEGEAYLRVDDYARLWRAVEHPKGGYTVLAEQLLLFMRAVRDASDV